MNIQIKMNKLSKLVITFLLFTAFSTLLTGEEITSSVSSLADSPTVDFFNSSQNLIDGDPSTSLHFNPSATGGWIDINLNGEYEISGLKLEGSGNSENLSVQVEYFSNSGWIPFALSRREGAQAFENIDLSYDRKVNDRIRLRFSSDNLQLIEIDSFALYGKKPETVFSKINISDTESSYNTSHFYSADYLSDGNARTLWAAYPHLFKKFPNLFGNDEIDRLDEVSDELDFLLGLSNFFKAFYTFFSEMDAELTLETPSSVEFINLFFTDNSDGDFTLSVLSEGLWSDIYVQPDTDALDNGWVRVPVGSNLGLIEKVSVHFEGDSLRLGGLSEIEVWGKGNYKGNTVVNIPVSSDNTLANTVVFESMLSKKSGLFVDLELQNYNDNAIELNFNGRQYTADKVASSGNDCLYSVLLNQDHIWEDGNYLTVPALGGEFQISSVKFFDREADLAQLFNNNLSDGFLYNSDDSKGSTQFDFDREYYFNKLNLHSEDGSNAQIFLHNGIEWQAQLDYNADDSIVTYELNQTGYKIIIDTGLFSSIGEVEFLGSPTEKIEPEIRVLWPSDGEILSKGFTSSTYMVGFIDNPEAIVTVNGLSVKQKGHTFWLPLRNFDVDENGALFIEAHAVSPEGESSDHNIMIFEDGYMKMDVSPEEDTVFTDDNSIIFDITSPSSMTIIAEVGDQTWQIDGRPQGVSLNVPLEEGFNFVTLKGVNKRNGKFYRIIHKKVIRNTGSFSIDILTPSENTWTNDPATSIEGVIIGTGDYTVTINDVPATTTDNYFIASGITLNEGENTINIIAEDSDGNIVGRNLVLFNDTTAPVLSIVKPEDGDFYTTGYMDVAGTVEEANGSVVLVNGKQTPVIDGAFSSQVFLYSEGLQTVELQALDIAGNKSAIIEKTVTIDTTAPLSFDIQSDVDGWTNTSPTLLFDTTDETSGISHYEISVNGESFQEVSSPYTVPSTVDGELKVYVKAIDNVGNSRTEEIYIYIDTTAPIAPPNFRGVPGNGKAEARWDASDEDVVEYRVSRIDDELGNVLLSTSELFVEEDGLENGEAVQYSIVAIDRAGNVSETDSSKIINIGVAKKNIAPESEDVTIIEYETSSIYVAPGSLPDDVKEINISEIVSEDMEELATYRIISPIYNYSVMVEDEGDTVYQDHVEYEEPFLAEIEYNESMVPEAFPENKLGVFYFDTMWGRWFKVEQSVIDPETNKIYFTSNHFSSFSVQPTVLEDLSPQELMDAGNSGQAPNTTYQDLNVSPQGGSARTEVSELVLPGVGGFNFELKRTYDTVTARGDGYGSSITASIGIDLVSLDVADIASVIGSAAKSTAIGLAQQEVNKILQNNGDYSYSMGTGWRLNLPYLRSNNGSVMIRLQDGSFYPVNNMKLVDDTYALLYREMTLENHENADFQLEIHQSKIPVTIDDGTFDTFVSIGNMQIPAWNMVSSKLTLKDGTVWEFDATGRATSMVDPTGKNKIVFEYLYKELKKIKLDILEDGAEEQEWTINLDYHLPITFFKPTIRTISVEGDTIHNRSISYNVDSPAENAYVSKFLPLLKSANDVGGRISSYDYLSHDFKGGSVGLKLNGASIICQLIPGIAVIAAQILPPAIEISGSYQYQTVYLMSGMSAPGLGYTSLDYNYLFLAYSKISLADFFLGFIPTALKATYSWNERPVVTKLRRYQEKGSSLENQITYSYDFDYYGHDQFINKQSVVNNGKTLKTYNYSTYEEMRFRWSLSNDHAEDVINGRGFTESPLRYIVTPYTKSTTITDLSTGQFIESSEMTYDLDTMRVLSERTERAADNYQENHFRYDFWGNRTYTKKYSRTGDRINSLETWIQYLNGGNTTVPEILWKTSPYVNPVLSNGNIRTLPLQRVVKNTVPAEANTISTQFINTAWEYNSLGQNTGETLWVDGTTTETFYEYDIYGNIAKVTNPEEHITEIIYDYSPVDSPGYYTITRTEKDVKDAEGTLSDVVSVSVLENKSGWKASEVNPRGYTTSFLYDDLGRTIKTDFEGSITTIDFNDPELITTVTNPVGAIAVYDYDSLGRLDTVTKDLRVLDDNFAETEDIEKSVYRLGYDNWDNVISMEDPNGNITGYEYDSMNRMSKVNHPTENGFSYSRTMDFDYATNIQTVTDEEGHLSFQSYDFSGRMFKNVQTFGNDDITTLTYFDGIGNEVRRIDGNGNSTSVFYNERKQPVKTVLPEEEFFENGTYVTVSPYTRAVYDKNGYKVQDIMDTEDGEYVISYENDELGRMIRTLKTVDGTQIEEKSYYDENGNIVRTVDSNGKENSFIYSSRDQVLSEINPENGIVSYTYDLKDRKETMTDPRENSGNYPGRDFNLIYHYDDLDRIVGAHLPETVSYPGKPVVRFSYDLKGNVLNQVNPDGGETSFTYSSRNNKEQETVSGVDLVGNPISYTTTYEYDGRKSITSITDPAGIQTTQIYDQLGRLSRVLRLEANNEYYEYDKVGNLVLSEDGKGNRNKSYYDSYNRVTEIEDALGGLTRFDFDRKGNQTRYEDSNSNVTRYIYDELNRVIEERNALDEVHSYTYDAVGNILTHTDPVGTVSTYEYTDLYLQRSLALENTDKGLFKFIENSWDEAGDIIWSTDDGIRTEYNTTGGVFSPDPYSRVLNLSRFIDGKEIRTGYNYDVMNRITEMTYPSGETVAYNYNNVSQLESIPGFIDQKISYDARGFLKSFKNVAGIDALFGYDNSGRQTGISYEQEEDVLKSFELSYDKSNNIVQKNNSSYSYDPLNRLKTSNENGKFAIDVAAKKIDDPEYSQRVGLAEFDVAGQKSLDFDSDQVDLLLDYASTSIGVDLGYDTFVTHLEIRPESIGHRIDSSNLEIFTSSSNFTGGFERQTDWIFEETDNVITITFREPVFGNYIKIHSQFDERNENNEAVDLATIKNNKRDLLTVFYTANLRDEEFVYDSKGNRLSSNSTTSLYTSIEEEEGRTYRYYPNSDRLMTVESSSEENMGYVWDKNGNMIAKGSDYVIEDNTLTLNQTVGYTEYEYDLLNRLIQVRKTDENGLLNTVATYTYDTKGYRIKKEGLEGTEYFAFSLDGMLLREENEEVFTEYIYAFNKVVAERRDGIDYFYLTDHLGSTVMMTDRDGNILWQNDVTPFGEETGESGFVERDGFYTGKKIDPDTGLYYFNARWYDPELGRFITEDPVKDGVNWFSYANQNPLRYLDPTGLEIVDFETKTMQKMKGNIPNTSIPMKEEGCTFSGMSGVVDDYRKKNDLDPIDWESKQENGEMDDLFDEDGKLKRDDFLKEFTGGKLKVKEDTRESGNDPDEVLDEADESEDPLYVLGRGKITTSEGKSEHEIGISGVTDGSIEKINTSDNDENRDYSTDNTENQIDRIITIGEVDE